MALSNKRISRATSSSIVSLVASGTASNSVGKPFFTYVEECRYEKSLLQNLEYFLGDSKNGVSDNGQIQFNCPECDDNGNHYNLKVLFIKNYQKNIDFIQTNQKNILNIQFG